MNKIISYFQGVREEIGKVSWPSRERTMSGTIGVIAVSVGVAAFMGVLDYVMNLGIGFLIAV